MLVIVMRVLDGDTFETAHGVRVRLAGFDAPELGEPGGKEAAEHLRKMILEKEVRIDQVGTSYDRVVAEVYLDGESVNNEMGYYLEQWELEELEL